MIASLKGDIIQSGKDFVVVDVGGVGYEIKLQSSNYNLQIGQEVRLFTYMAVSENDISLYGFRTREELDLFKMLITVSGVGSKTAAGILGGCNGSDLIKAIGEADVKFFEKIKGVGKKTAQRIIVDLKSKVGGLGELNLKDDLPLQEDELTLGLQQLGFEKKEIVAMIDGLPVELVTTEEKLEWCLRNRK